MRTSVDRIIAAVCGLVVAAPNALAQTAKPVRTKSAPASESGLTYARDIRPILQARCVVCHNGSTASTTAVSGGLALDSYSAVKAGVSGSKTGAVLTPGKSGASHLYERLVAASPARLMPKGGPALPAAQISLIKRWIDAGAPVGATAPGATAARPPPDSIPMPANRPALAVTLPTKAALPADLLEKGAKTLLLSLTIGPLPPITALAYSPDGKRLAIGAYRAVAIWDTATGKPITCLTHLPGAVLALAFRPDGSTLAVGGGVPGASGDIRLYDTTGWARSGPTLGGHTDAVASVGWSRDGARIASGSQDRSARVWEWPSGKELRVFRDHSDGVSRVCFAPDGKSLYTASLDHNARRFDIEKGGLLRLFSGHNDAITALAVSPDGKRLVTSGGEPNLRWWNVDTGDTTNNNGGHSASVAEVTFAKDGTLVASASADKTLRIWDGASTQQKRTLEGSADWVYTASISPDDRFAAGGGADGIVRLWEAGTGRLRLSLIFWPPPKDRAPFDWIAVTPEGYFDGSPGWQARVNAANAAKGAPLARVRSAIHALEAPESVVKAWQGAALDPPKQPTK
jgi:Tol biopolymer transport system component